jgi:hypothetical protein
MTNTNHSRVGGFFQDKRAYNYEVRPDGSVRVVNRDGSEARVYTASSIEEFKRLYPEVAQLMRFEAG